MSRIKIKILNEVYDDYKDNYDIDKLYKFYLSKYKFNKIESLGTRFNRISAWIGYNNEGKPGIVAIYNDGNADNDEFMITRNDLQDIKTHFNPKEYPITIITDMGVELHSSEIKKPYGTFAKPIKLMYTDIEDLIATGKFS